MHYICKKAAAKQSLLFHSGYGLLIVAHYLLCFCAQMIAFRRNIDHNRGSFFYLICKNDTCSQCFHILLKVTFQRTCTIYRIISMIRNKCLSSICKTQLQLSVCQTFVQVCYSQINNTADIILSQRLEQDHFVQTVQKLRSEVGLQIIHDHLSCFFTDIAVFINSL